MLVIPVGLSWELERTDLSFFYGFVAPTGTYETGSDANLGLGFWTRQFQGFGYLYPAEGKSTAIMLGLTYELNSKIKDADLTPGNRFSLEWGISQYFSDQFEWVFRVVITGRSAMIRVGISIGIPASMIGRAQLPSVPTTGPGKNISHSP